MASPRLGPNRPDLSQLSSAATSFVGIERSIPHRNHERTPLLNESDAEQASNVSSSTGPTNAKRGSLRQKIKYYIPSTVWIPNYTLSLFGGDLTAGITLACMLIPQAVSYSTSLAHLSPTTGLYSAAIPGIVYALLGTCRQLNVAPEAALTLVMGEAVYDVQHDHSKANPHDMEAMGIAVATIITFQAGLISFLLGFFRLGFIDVVLSRALLRGFITAVAIVIMVEQLIPMFGLTALQQQLHPHSTFEKIVFLLENCFTNNHHATTFVSFGALLALLVIRKFKSYFVKYWWIYRLPEVFLVAMASTILSYKFRWDEQGVGILGSVPIKHGGSFVQIPLSKVNLGYLRQTTSSAVVIAVVGFLDSIVSAKQNSARYGYSISPNRELVALGAANLAASFVPGTLPAYGSITRSRINGDVGGRTQMASIVCSVLVLLTTFFLLPYLFYLPKCVLASVVLLVVFSLLSEAPEDIHFYWKMGAWVDMLLMFLTFFFSIVWNVEAGIVISLIISLLIVVHRSSKTRMTILGRIPGTDKWEPVNEEVVEEVPGALIVRIRENLDFANTAQLKERLRRLELYGLEQHHPSEDPRRQQASDIVFHLSDVETCDASAVLIFYELLETYHDRGVRLYITHIRPGPRKMFAKAGIIELLGYDAFYDNVADAINRIARAR